MMIQVPMIDRVIVVDLIDDILPVLVRIHPRFFSLNASSVFLAIPNNHYTTVNSHQQNYDNTHSTIEQDRDESIDSFKTDERSSKGRTLNHSFLSI